MQIKKYILKWKSNGLSDESMKPLTTSDISLALLIDCLGNKIRLQFYEIFLKQEKITYTHSTTVNIYIVYELTGSSSKGNDPALKISWFGAVKLTKNADIYKYGYSGYGIGFDRRESFHFQVVDLAAM